MYGGACYVTVHGVAKSWTWLHFHFEHYAIYHKNFVLPDFTSSSNMQLGYNMVWMFESSTNLYIEMLALTTMLLNLWEVIRSWEWSSHNEISAFTEEAQESSQTILSSEDTEKKSPLWINKPSATKHRTCWCHDPELPTSITVRNQCLLFISYSVSECFVATWMD